MGHGEPQVVQIDVRGAPEVAFGEALLRCSPALRFCFHAAAPGEPATGPLGPPHANLGFFVVDRVHLLDFCREIRPLAKAMIEEEISFQCQGRVLDLRQDPEANQQEVLDSYARNDGVFYVAPGPFRASRAFLDALAAEATAAASTIADLADVDERVVT